MPLFGPPNVKKLEADNNINGLVKALGYKKDAGIRQAAARALGQIALIPGLGLAESLVLAAAAEHLAAALNDDEPEVRRAATIALEQLGAPGIYVPRFLQDATLRAVQEPLIAALSDEEPKVRRAAAYVLGEVCEKLGDAALGTRAVERLTITLEDEDSNVRWAVAVAIGGIGRDIRNAALQALIVERLIATLKDREWEVRRGAAQMLGEIGAELEDATLRGQVVEQLIAILEDENSKVREVSTKALKTMTRQNFENVTGWQEWWNKHH